MNTKQIIISVVVITVTSGVIVGSAFADRSYHAQVNISGATLFNSFFQAQASTNDFIDADSDGFAGFHFDGPPYVEDLATAYAATGDWTP
jgi:hypothetical protein